MSHVVIERSGLAGQARHARLRRCRDRVLPVLLAAAIAHFAVLPAVAQGISARQADELLRQNQEILKELKGIRSLLERQQAAPARAAAPAPAPRVDEKVTLRLPADAFVLGRADAPLTMVEYTDYQCPFCRRYHIGTFEEIRRDYIDTGKLRYVSRDFPLPIHENARAAALAGRCAAEQGKFWEMRHVMIVNANLLQRDKLVTYARDLKLDVDKFNACLAADAYGKDIDRQIAEGQAIGVSGTPSFVLARSNGDKLEGVRLVGAQPYAVFDAKLKELLGAAAQ